MQPFRPSQKVLIEKRDAAGNLDFSDPQPPPKPMTFDDVYRMFFREVKDECGSWDNLSKWLTSKGWSLRAAYWA